MISLRAVLRTAFRPEPVASTIEAIRASEAAIDRMVATVERIRETSLNGAIDDIAEARR